MSDTYITKNIFNIIIYLDNVDIDIKDKLYQIIPTFQYISINRCIVKKQRDGWKFIVNDITAISVIDNINLISPRDWVKYNHMGIIDTPIAGRLIKYSINMDKDTIILKLEVKVKRKKVAVPKNYGSRIIDILPNPNIWDNIEQEEIK